MNEKHSFIIPISLLKRKVEMHTSRIGMSRKDEDSPYLTDKYSLTEGENFLFEDYLKEAVGKTYNWIKAFGRTLPNACMIYPEGTLTELHETNGVYVTVNGIRKSLKEINIPVTSEMYTTELVEESGDDKTYKVSLSLPEINIYIGQATQIDFILRARYTTLADEVFEESCAYDVTQSVTDDDEQGGDFDFNVTLNNSMFAKRIKSVDSFEVIITGIAAPTHTFSKGDYVKMTYEDGSIMYGIVDEANGTAWHAIWRKEDLRGSVVFDIELREWEDQNMLMAAQEHLTNAIVFYIMYRWFETVQDGVMTMYGGRWHKPESQAEKFYMKYEEEGYAAKSSLNSQRRILQRKATWLQ